MADARITFADPSLSHTAVGTTDASGNFVLTFLNKIGAPEGNFRVSINKQGISPEKEGLFIEMVPARYNRATGLTAQVDKAGPNVFTFDHLTSERDAKDEQRPGVPPAVEPKGGAKAQDADAEDPLLKQLDRSRNDRD